jgi:membrane protein implicated in regulation of membrane protease activity
MICGRSFLEASANTAVGSVLNIAAALVFGIPITTTLSLTLVFIILSNLRAYVLRRVFARLWAHRDGGAA